MVPLAAQSNVHFGSFAFRSKRIDAGLLEHGESLGIPAPPALTIFVGRLGFFILPRYEGVFQRSQERQGRFP